MLQQCIDSLVQKIQHGVVINFEKMGPDPAPLYPESVCTLSLTVAADMKKSLELLLHCFLL